MAYKFVLKRLSSVEERLCSSRQRVLGYDTFHYPMIQDVFSSRKDKPDILKKAKFFPVRVRDEVSGKTVLQHHVNIYEQIKG